MTSKPRSQVPAADLLEAYRKTSFLAETSGGTICIRIGQTDPALEILLKNEGAQSWAYVTAWNPGSIPLADEANRLREREVEQEARKAGYTILKGQGVGEDGAWPPEPSLLILGIPLEEALVLGRAFGQVAIVAGQRGEQANLVFC